MFKPFLFALVAAFVFTNASPSYALLFQQDNNGGGALTNLVGGVGDILDVGLEVEVELGLELDCEDQTDDCLDPLLDCVFDLVDCTPNPSCDNPVPEPATAGLAFMSLGALTAAVRRRRNQ